MCLTPAKCHAQAISLETSMAKWSPVGHRELQTWRVTPDCDKSLMIGFHGHERKRGRNYSNSQIVSAVETGEVIERFLRKRSEEECFRTGRPSVEVSLLIAHSIKQVRDGKVVIRYIHVAVVFVPGSRHLTITTVYDPEDEAERWTDDYTRRVCWCKTKQFSGGKEGV